MYASRKLDSEDPNVVQMLRIAYIVIQCIILSLVVYFYVKAKALQSTKEGEETVYVPPAKQPFADPNAKTKYTQVKYGDHVVSTTISLLGSTLFGIVFTFGLHLYRGVIIGLAMQVVMGPMGLFESPLLNLFVLGKTKVFEEKTKEELTPEDEVVDSEGNTITVGGTKAKAKAKNETKSIKEEAKKEVEKSFEDVLLDTWDLGSDADIKPLMNALMKSNINFVTAENKWTPLMIMSGIGAKDSVSAIGKMKELGADPHITDGEGWNCLHWAAYHGSVDAVLKLKEEFEALDQGMHLVKDKEGKTPLDHAKKEGNEEVRVELETWEIEEVCEEKESTDEGLRKRK